MQQVVLNSRSDSPSNANSLDIHHAWVHAFAGIFWNILESTPLTLLSFMIKYPIISIACPIVVNSATALLVSLDQ